MHVQVGSSVVTPRGQGVALAINGAPGSESVLVRFDSHLEVDFAAHEVWLTGERSLEQVENFLGSDADRLADIEAFLADPDRQAVAQPPSGGLTRGATTLWCSCPCGGEKGCMRLSTAPALHQPQTGSCRCAQKGCGCLA